MASQASSGSQLASPSPSTTTVSAAIPPVDLDYILSHMMTIGRIKTGISTCITEQDITELLLNVKALFMAQPMMLELEAPVTVCGDIHGQFTDLMRIFSKCGFPDKTNYLFLGDYVDRGRMSLEVLKYPENFFLLRGNHETQLVNRIYGFYEEIVRRYLYIRLYALFQDVFNVMPLSALIGGRILCMHGGLSPSMLKSENILDMLKSIYRPLPDPPNPSLPLDLLWADPDPSTDDFKYSDRGLSLTFGVKVVNKVCEKLNVDLVCRAHQVVQDGYEFFANRKLVTIFSAPHYCGIFDNAAATMVVNKQMQCSFKILRPRFPKMQKTVFDSRKDVTCYGHPNHNFRNALCWLALRPESAASAFSYRWLRNQIIEKTQNLRTTTEESNLSITPLQIVRGFAALHLLADGKCKKMLAKLISNALFGPDVLPSQRIHQDLAHLYTSYLEPPPNGAIQIFLEESLLLPFDDELVDEIEKHYGRTDSQLDLLGSFEPEDNVRKKGVVQPACFQISPNGQALMNEMNKNIKKATRGIVENVVRRDLAPEWRSRFALATSYDSTFYWKPPVPVMEVETFFFESFTKDLNTRSVVKAYRCDGLFRTCLTRDKVRVIELTSDTERLTMYLFQPKKPFSNEFLKNLKSEQLQHYINEIAAEPQRTSVVIPCFSIISPVGLRPVFGRCKPVHHLLFKNKHPQYPYPCIARIFSPHKAEFGIIYGKHSEQFYGTSYIFPLWDHYHKTKMALKTERPTLEKGSEDEQRQVTYEGKTMKDDTGDRRFQEITTLTGKMMIIGSSGPGADQKQYIVGILEDEGNGDGFQRLHTQSQSVRGTKRAKSAEFSSSVKRQGTKKVGAVKAYWERMAGSAKIGKKQGKYAVSKNVSRDTVEENASVLKSGSQREYLTVAKKPVSGRISSTSPVGSMNKSHNSPVRSVNKLHSLSVSSLKVSRTPPTEVPQTSDNSDVNEKTQKSGSILVRKKVLTENKTNFYGSVLNNRHRVVFQNRLKAGGDKSFDKPSKTVIYTSESSKQNNMDNNVNKETGPSDQTNGRSNSGRESQVYEQKQSVAGVGAPRTLTATTVPPLAAAAAAAEAVTIPMPEPDVPFAQKQHTIVIAPDEAPQINPYFVANDMNAREMHAEVIFDTPFLYMTVSRSETGRQLVVGMGRFTNIQETNPRMQPSAFDVNNNPNMNKNNPSSSPNSPASPSPPNSRPLGNVVVRIPQITISPAERSAHSSQNPKI